MHPETKVPECSFFEPSPGERLLKLLREERWSAAQRELTQLQDDLSAVIAATKPRKTEKE